MEAFEKEGINFALPTTTYLVTTDERPLEMMSSDSPGKKIS